MGKMIGCKPDHLRGCIDTNHLAGREVLCNLRSYLPIPATDVEDMFVATELQFTNEFLRPLVLGR